MHAKLIKMCNTLLIEELFNDIADFSFNFCHNMNKSLLESYITKLRMFIAYFMFIFNPIHKNKKYK